MTTLHESYLVCKRKFGVEVSRELLLATYRQCRNIKQTAKEWHCSKNTVKLALWKKKNKNNLKDSSRAPNYQPCKTASDIEQKIYDIRRQTGYGKRRIQNELFDQFSIVVPESTIGKILKRGNVKAKIYHSAWRRKTRNSYDRSSLLPFGRNEVDVKEVLDQKGLSQEIYDLFTRLDLPLYQWTWIDVFSRLRFVAYSYEHSWTNGRIFFQLVTSWLRLFGIRKTLNCSIDGGTEWHANHERSFVESLDNFYQPLGLNMSVIRKGHPEDNAFVERSHRTDDEECYVPMGKYIKGERSFQKTIQWWQLFYNTQRRHQGIGNKTPIQQLKTHNNSIHPAIAHFPPIILDRHLNCMPGGQNVFDYYQICQTVT